MSHTGTSLMEAYYPMEPGSICHVDWHSVDFEQAKKFYGGLFGWTFQEWDEHYMLFHAPGNASGGFAKTDQIDYAKGAVVYMLVTDIEASRQKAIELGGTASPAMEIPGYGSISFLTDLEGNKLGIFQAK